MVRVRLVRLRGCVFGEEGWLMVVVILLYVLFEGMCYGAVGVRGGLGWACVYRMGC